MPAGYVLAGPYPEWSRRTLKISHLQRGPDGIAMIIKLNPILNVQWALQKAASISPTEIYTVIRGSNLTQSSVIMVLNFRTLGLIRSFFLTKTSKASTSSTATIRTKSASPVTI